jgi:phosphopantetheinyl transferase
MKISVKNLIQNKIDGITYKVIYVDNFSQFDNLELEPSKYRFRIDALRHWIGLELVKILEQDWNNIGAETRTRTRNKNCVYTSVSHTTGLVVAMIADSPCGIDAEFIDPKKVFKEAMSPKDWEIVQSDNNAFFKFWTIKEALYKMDNDSFSMPPDEYTVSENSDLIRYNVESMKVDDCWVSYCFR